MSCGKAFQHLEFPSLNMEMVMHSTGDESEDRNAWKPHFFKIIVSPIIQLQRLHIPAAFIEKFGKALLNYASLKAPEGAVWKVGLTKREGDVWFDGGWQDFAEYHSLEFGHFLVFKYQGNSQFEVSIFDQSCTEIEYPNRSTIKGTEKGEASNKNRRRLDHDIGSKLRGVKNRAVERAKAFECSNPHFAVVVHPSYLSHRFTVTVPASYAREHVKKESNYTIRLQTATEGKIWPMKCYFPEDERVVIGAGWKKFLRDNRLRVGDVCLFELTHQVAKTYMVHIFRSRDDE